MKFRPYDQSQTKFVNLNYREVLGEDSDAVIINDIIERLDFSRSETRYVEVGNPAYHPKVMMKILIYGYYKSYFGGRPLYNNFHTDIGLRFLSNDDFPDHRTINLFRVQFKNEIADIFAQVVMICKELHMIGFENLSIDSQKIKANANLFQSKNLNGVIKERERIEWQLMQLLDQDIQIQQDPDVVKKKKEKLIRRKEKLNKAAQLLKDAHDLKTGKERYNLTDPDSQLMTDKRKVINPDYNCHNAVDDTYQIITAIEVTNKPSDNEELFPLKEASKKNTGKTHTNTLADCGYSDKGQFNDMRSDQETDYYVPDRTMALSKRNKYCKWHFEYDSTRDVFICPAGKDLKFVKNRKDSKGLKFRLYRGVSCDTCSNRDKCFKKLKKPGKRPYKKMRTISVYPEDKLIKEMRNKLDSVLGKKIYKKRASNVELVHGDIQKNRGFTQFGLRGLSRVIIEYTLIGIVHNLRKIILHRRTQIRSTLAKALMIIAI